MPATKTVVTNARTPAADASRRRSRRSRPDGARTRTIRCPTARQAAEAKAVSAQASR
jgi:hypothetical protein